MNLRLALLLAAAGIAVIAACAQNPVTGQQDFVMMSEADEIQLGKKADQEVRQEYGKYDVPRLQRYVEGVGQKLAAQSHRPGIAYHFTVLDSPEVNAFALPGGYVYITRGIMAYLNSEAEMAAVVGHEVGHVTARHSVRQYSATMAAGLGTAVLSVFVPEAGRSVTQDILGTLGNALLAGYGRDHELEADRLGAEYLARTGYDTQAMIRVIGVLKDQELFDAEVARSEGREPRRYHGLFATHPDNDTRLQQVVGEAARVARGPGVERRGEFLRETEGMIFGDDASQGLVRGSRFLHPELGLGVDFPTGWKVTNHPERVAAINPDRSAAMEMRLADKAEGTPERLLLSKLKIGTGTRVESLRIGGQDAAMATFTSGGGRPTRAGMVFFKGNAYLIVGQAASSDAFRKAGTAITESIRSFHPLTESERREARPFRIRTITAKQGTTFRDLAKVSPLGKHAEGHLRLLNAKYPKGEPAPGDTVKIVE